MGFLGGLKAGSAVEVAAEITAAYCDVPNGGFPYSSPFASPSLEKIIFEDVFGQVAQRPVNRAQGMALPPLARGRNRLVSTISAFPLVQMTGDPDRPATEAVRSARQARWLSSTAGPLHPGIRMAWTIDDLIWSGFSLWSRNPVDLTPGARIDKCRWRFDGDGHILVDDVIQREDQILLFCGLHEGILSYGAQSIRDAADLYRIVRQRLKNPAPNLNLSQTSGAPLTDVQIDELLVRWGKAREGELGGVGFTGIGIDVEEIGAMADAALMVDARNAAAVDLARIVGVSASVVDATAPKASLNYETSEGRNLEFVDVDLALYMLPIKWRLSMDDVVPVGDYITFDQGDYTAKAPSPTGPIQGD